MKHEIPRDPLTREAVRLTLPNEKLLHRKRMTQKWSRDDAKRFGQFVKARRDKDAFCKWVRLRKNGRAPNNPQYELDFARFERMRSGHQ